VSHGSSVGKAVDAHTGRCLHQLIGDQAVRSPDAIAVISGDAWLSYAELDRRASRLASRLARLGATPDTPVAVCAERGAELMVALLGVLKAGAAYLPLDPEYPAGRLAFMLADSGARIVLTQERLLGQLPPAAAEAVCLDDHGQDPPPSPSAGRPRRPRRTWPTASIPRVPPGAPRACSSATPASSTGWSGCRRDTASAR